MQQCPPAGVADPVSGGAGSGDTGRSDADAQRTGHGERDGCRQGSGHDASGDRDLLHLDWFGWWAFGLGCVGVAQDVSWWCG
jgi:hypothetical protein